MEDVEGAVEAEEEDVVRGDVLHVLEAVDHEELRQDGQGFEPDAEGPQEVDGVERFVGDDCGEEGCAVEVVVREGVGFAVETEEVGLLDAHEVDGVGGEGDEDHLHHEDVERLPAQEEVDVPGEEHCQEQFLRAVGQSCVLQTIPITFLFAMIFSRSISTAIRCRKSPISWNRSILTW